MLEALGFLQLRVEDGVGVVVGRLSRLKDLRQMCKISLAVAV